MAAYFNLLEKDRYAQVYMYIFWFGVVITGDGAKPWLSLQGCHSRKNKTLPHFASQLTWGPLTAIMQQCSKLLHHTILESLLT